MMLEEQFRLSRTDEMACARDEANHCLTCSDAVETVRVIQLDESTGLALVEWQQAILEIDVSLLDAVASGDFILVHGGVALGRAEEQ